MCVWQQFIMAGLLMRNCCTECLPCVLRKMTQERFALCSMPSGHVCTFLRSVSEQLVRSSPRKRHSLWPAARSLPSLKCPGSIRRGIFYLLAAFCLAHLFFCAAAIFALASALSGRLFF